MADCKLWAGALNDKGYGVRRVKGKKYLAHRYAYITHHCIPATAIAGIEIRHTCDVRCCVEPTHLIPGTHAENMQDMTSRARQSKGTERPSAKLNDADVKLIRSLYVKGSMTCGSRQLAKRFGVSATVILRVVNGSLWKHVQDN